MVIGFFDEIGVLLFEFVLPSIMPSCYGFLFGVFEYFFSFDSLLMTVEALGVLVLATGGIAEVVPLPLIFGGEGCY